MQQKVISWEKINFNNYWIRQIAWGFEFTLVLSFQEDKSKKSNLVVYGTKENQEDITNGLILDLTFVCPPVCGGDEFTTFTGDEGGFINPELARSFTSQFQNDHPEAIRAYFFGAEKLLQLLDQPDCVGIRFYSGLQELEDRSMKSNLVLYGVYENKEDIAEGFILEFSKPCPPFCGSGNGN